LHHPFQKYKYMIPLFVLLINIFLNKYHKETIYFKELIHWMVNGMKDFAQNRAAILGEYIVENKATVRATAAKFNISKSTVHTVVTIMNGLCGW